LDTNTYYGLINKILVSPRGRGATTLCAGAREQTSVGEVEVFKRHEGPTVRTGEIVFIFFITFFFLLLLLLLLPGVVEGGQSCTVLRGITGPQGL
jgi:hypothetical protein